MKRPNQSPVEESVEAYRQSLTEADRMLHRNRVCRELEKALNECTVSEPMIFLVAKILTEFKLWDIDVENIELANSIKVCCRCRTVEALYGLKQLIDSGEVANHFGHIMSCLIREQVTAFVTMSEEDFNKCLNSLTDAAG